METKNIKVFKRFLVTAIMIALLAVSVSAGISAVAAAEGTVAAPASDPSPAIYVAQKNANSVVGVTTVQEKWDRMTRIIQPQTISGGSGVVIKEGGYILTNDHVVAGGSAFEILMPSGETAKAELVGTDPSSDIAVLKVEEQYASELVPVELGSLSELMVGSTVIAFGNPGDRDTLANTVTQGIVSALSRTVSPDSSASRGVTYIQHDAALNPGNSGGPLFNYKGELVGINNWKMSSSGYYDTASIEGLGFAIQVEVAYKNAMLLIENGSIKRSALGISAYEYDGPDDPLPSDPPISVMVYELLPGKAAETAGIRQYDFIYAMNGVRVKDIAELFTELDKYEVGTVVTLTIVRYKSIILAEEQQYQGEDDIFGDIFEYHYGPNLPTFSGGFDKLAIEVELTVLDD
jgi:serine protease Do